ncbi:MAG TPA: tetratricopeptide repeat protein, partial [Chloroflexota bacterium]|nr:tetratricopeptide repeat protein [Chloroflexota bacterium]
CAQLCDSLLRACPDLKILATSREPLRILGELTWRVPSLSLPLSPVKGDRRRAPPDVGQYDAIRLFVERARAVEAPFNLTADNAPVVTQICGRLDGIPLAIELAASRVGTLSLEQIAARLDDAFRLLTGGSRSALPRQQTLRALMDWSHDLLSDSERVLWRRLAVFAGTFTLDAAEQVCSDKDIKDDARASSPLAPRQTGFILHPSVVVELLSQLVNKSLVVAEPAEGDVRYRLLQTVRQYAFEKLSAAGEDHLLRERHRRYYLALVEKAEPALLGPAQATELKRLEAEYDNLLAALTWSKQASDRHGDDASEHAAALAQLCGALWSLWYARGSLNEGRQWLAEVLARRPLLDEQSHGALVKVLAGAGALAWSQGDYVHAQAYSSESLALSETAEHPTSMTVAALTVLGIIAQDQGDYVRATIVHEESLRLMRAAEHAFGIGLTLNALGNLARLQGDYARALTHLDEALGIQRANGDQWGTALSTHNLAQVAYDQGDTARAKTLGDEALRTFRAIGNTWGTAVALFNLAEVALREQDAPSARQLSTEALGLYEALDDKVGRGRVLHLLGQALWASGDRPGALRVWRESLQVRHQVGDKLGMVTILEQFAAAADSEGESARAARLFGAAEALQQSITIAHPPAARTDPSGSIAQAQRRCGAPEWQSAWAVGRALSLDEVVEFALNQSRPA